MGIIINTTTEMFREPMGIFPFRILRQMILNDNRPMSLDWVHFNILQCGVTLNNLIYGGNN